MSRIIGPYAIQGLLGSGGIGQVYAALDQDLGRRVALKMLRHEFSEDPDLLERFRNEAANLARLNHPNITTLYSLYRDTSSQRQSVFMVMEMVNGETLEAILARTGRFNTRGCLAVMAQAVAGLSYAHSVGIIHRDIKPSNMMLNDAGLLKITDFGIARVQGSQRLTRHGAVVGTLNYIAPEQIKGQESDERSDLYSLACVLYELLSGRKPFVGLNEYELIRAQLDVQPEPLSASIPDLLPSVDRAIMRALAKNPEDRFSSVGEFAEVLGTASVQDAAVTVVRQMVLANVPPLPPSARDEPLFPDIRDVSPDATQAVRTALEPALAPVPTRQRRERVAAAVAAAAMVVATGGAYLAHTMRAGSDAVAAPQASAAPAGPAVTPPRQPEASGNATLAQARPLDLPDRPTAAQTTPSDPHASPTTAPIKPSTPQSAPATIQATAPARPASEAVSRAPLSASGGNFVLIQSDPAGSSSVGPQGPAPTGSQSVPTPAAAPPDGEDLPVPVLRPTSQDAPPLTDATAMKTVPAYQPIGPPLMPLKE